MMVVKGRELGGGSTDPDHVSRKIERFTIFHVITGKKPPNLNLQQTKTSILVSRIIVVAKFNISRFTIRNIHLTFHAENIVKSRLTKPPIHLQFRVSQLYFFRPSGIQNNLSEPTITAL